MITDNPLHTEFTRSLIDLAAERVGGETLTCSDDFFAPMENLIKPGRGVFIADKYTDRGKWMDGWESRRSFGRDNGRDHDWCILRLGIPGIIKGIDVDTNHFRGNAPLAFSLDAACLNDDGFAGKNHPEWVEILPQRLVEAHSQNLFRIPSLTPWSHVRLNIYPDGGVARLRVYGQPHITWSSVLTGELVDLAAITNGGQAIQCSDMFFSDKNNLLMPGRATNMSDGWETKRRRDNQYDWVIIKLGAEGSINKVIVDTNHFKGNYPDRFSLEAITAHNDDFYQNKNWQTIIPDTKLMAHHEHLLISEIIADPRQTFTHVRLNIFPDGGISRLRVFGYRKEDLL
ncbi:allantoicase [Endozoicomonas sp. SM1973]|uniref:Probable allantoicase n=1 Tax=Spartinivicinus marinus TaxID=2994442 RepID=A0A853I7B4_9GAMM|nr:allantoicase [Spartinivicinus marinus]MCX4029521.1 allantoicase [Spartinivicinus marinus]NYZ65095.1 allantoicase [Spartinivicinus marinus]